MSTATTLPPDRPLRPVWTPQDAEDTRRALRVQKSRWAAFLTAKDLLLGRLNDVGGTVEQTLERWHLGSAVSMVRRAAGWLFGGFGMLRRALTTTGVRPAVAWLLSTSTGQRVAGTVVRTVGRVIAGAGRAALKAVGWCLRLFGSWGARTAQRVEQLAHRVTVNVETRVRPLGMVTGALLDPEGMPMQAVRTLAKGHLLSGLLKRFLPAPWNVLAGVLGNLIALPLSLQRAALGLVVGTPVPPTSTPSASTPFVSTPSVSTPAASPVDPDDDDDPTPPAAPAAVVDLDAERTRHQDAVDEVLAEVEPSLARYPATRRSPNAKRRR